MTEEELEQRVNDLIDRERIKTAILKLEIDKLKKAVKKVENVSGLHDLQRERDGAGVHPDGNQ